MKTAIALYNDVSTANQVAEELREYGIDRDSIRIVDNTMSDLSSMLTEGGLPADHVHEFVEGVQQGATLVSVRSEDEYAETVVQIMERYHPIDVHERAAQRRQTSGQHETTDAQIQSTQQIQSSQTTTQNQEGETTIPIVEEEVRVGKRQVASGGVRIHTHVEEQPVEEQIRLRDESVVVERRPVNRKADSRDLTAAQEGEFEVDIIKEEAVVEKEARIVEEVVVKKQAEERTETIRDTVRRTDVEVEQVAGQPTTTTWDDTAFRSHFKTNYANSGYTYAEYEPAYQYGYTLASDQRYQGNDWKTIEPQARKEWNKQHQDSAWDNFKDVVRHSWEQTKNAVKR